MKPVDKYSFGYHLARSWVKYTSRFIFYRRWKARGFDKIDPKIPTIFAANHQNALMDALNVSVVMKAQPIFLVRADIFKKQYIARILNWMKLMPVYRIRDGFDSLQKNEEIFEKCASVLGKGRSMIIFPEGNHGNQRHLRILKKGLARVAFGAEKARDYKLGLQVIPIGVDYSNYEKFRSTVTVSVGDPIQVAQFTDLYQEDYQKGLKALNEAIRTNLEPHMIEIPWKNEYDGVMGIRQIYGARYAEKSKLPYKKLFERFDADKQLIAQIGKQLEADPEKIQALGKKAATYLKIVKRSKLRNHVLEKAPYGFIKLLFDTLLLLIGFPFFLYGLINTGLIFYIPDKLSRSLIKDPQFRSSIAFVLSMVVLLPLFFVIQTLVVSWIFEAWWLPWAYLISLVPMGLFAIHYSYFFKKTRARIGFSRASRKKDGKVRKLIEMHTQLIQEIDALIV